METTAEFEPSASQATGFPQGREGSIPRMQTDPQVLTQPSVAALAASPQELEQIRDLWKRVCSEPLVQKAVTVHADTGRALLAPQINIAKAKGIDTFYWERHPDTPV